MFILPYIETDELKLPPKDGRIFKCISFCRESANLAKCQKFIRSINELNGFHICPYGFTCHVKRQDGMALINCSMRVMSHFLPKKANPKIQPEDPPPITPEMFINCMNETIGNISVRRSRDDLVELLEVTLHEVRKLNRDIKSQAEELNIELSKGSVNHEFVRYRVQNVFGTSSLISVRLDTFDLISNPELVTSNVRIPFQIYKKFEKTIHCLDNMCKKRRVKISWTGSSFNSIDAYPVLELLPYVLLENALKYSPEDQNITVTFLTNTVTIDNVGPLLDQGESEKIFGRKYRGGYAGQMFSGTGNGLFFAGQVCELHGITIGASSIGPTLFRLNNVPYSTFRVTLDFPSNNQG